MQHTSYTSYFRVYICTGGAFVSAEMMAKVIFPLVEARQGLDPDLFHISKYPLIPGMSAIPLARNRPWQWKEEINRVMSRLHNGGLVNFHVNKYIKDRWLR